MASDDVQVKVNRKLWGRIVRIAKRKGRPASHEVELALRAWVDPYYVSQRQAKILASDAPPLTPVPKCTHPMRERMGKLCNRCGAEL